MKNLTTFISSIISYVTSLNVKFLSKSVLVLTLLLTFSCSEDPMEAPVGKESHTVASASIAPSGFNLWTTCGSGPYISGSNVIVPLGTGCGTKYAAAQAYNSIYGSNFAVNSNLAGGSGASSGASELAIFVCDNVSTWVGNEMGFVRTLSDNVLKAYVQGGGQYIYTVVGGTGWHNYKCSASGLRKVDFYIDNVYRTSLTNNSGSYQNRNWYFVGAAQYHGGGNPSNWSTQFNSANVW